MMLVVFGAAGATGRQVVRQALIAGEDVVAASRHPDDYPIHSPHLRVVKADATDADSVEQAVTGADAVISCIGVKLNAKNVTLYSTGTSTITTAMAHRGVRRFACVSSDTVATEYAPGTPLFRRKVLKPLLREKFGRDAYDDMARMEKAVEASDLDWTIARPSLLFDACEPTSDYVVAPRRLPNPYTSRIDLADALVTMVRERQFSRSIVGIATVSGTPPFVSVFAKEALGIGS